MLRGSEKLPGESSRGLYQEYLGFRGLPSIEVVHRSQNNPYAPKVDGIKPSPMTKANPIAVHLRVFFINFLIIVLPC